MGKIERKIKDLFNKLSDLTFGEIITLRALRFMYWLEIVLGGVLAAMTVVWGFNESVFLGVLAAVVSPILLFIYVVIVKIIFEVSSVIFRISSLLDKVSNLSTKDFIEDKKRIRVDDYEVEEGDKENEKNDENKKT